MEAYQDWLGDTAGELNSEGYHRRVQALRQARGQSAHAWAQTMEARRHAYAQLGLAGRQHVDTVLEQLQRGDDLVR